MPDKPVTSDPVPPLAPPRAIHLPHFDQRRLRNGLTVVALRRTGVPIVEMRLRLPLVTSKPKARARADVLTETLLAGTANHSKVEIAAGVQALGASLGVSSDEDWLQISGSVLSTRLVDLLGVLSEVLREPVFPDDEVGGEAARLAERIRIARSQAGVQASEALARRLFGAHPYGMGLSDPIRVRRVTGDKMRTFFAHRIGPAGGTLVLVGDIEPTSMIDSAEAALQEWSGAEDVDGGAAQPPQLDLGAPLLLVDRRDSVQSALRIGGGALRRDDPDYPAFQLANLVFGGYFSSRLVTNLREDKGYTYSPHSLVEHSAAGSHLTIEADVATEVTAPALLETRYELGRMATLPVEQSELDDAREYAIGSLAVGTASHAGLASTVAALLASGVGVEFLAEHPARLRSVTVAQVQEQAYRFLAPAALTTVVVADAEAVCGSLEVLGTVERG